MRFSLLIGVFLVLINSLLAQTQDELVIKEIFDNVLESQVAYENLRILCDKAPGRLLGTEEAAWAVDFMKAYFEELGADTVFLQAFSTPAWIHHSSRVSMMAEGEEIELSADALGPSPSTPTNGLKAHVIEVQGLEELKELGEDAVMGKLVFFNRAVDLKHVNTFRVYTSAIDQRYHGPRVAAELGAVGALIRSVGTRVDDYPHTGSTGFKEKRIPCAALSTIAANQLSEALKKNQSIEVSMFIDSEDLEKITTYNLIADLKGYEKPDEYLVVGGHIDAWFNSPGAHDDGVGCVQSADVMRIFKELQLKNKRSIRIIMFMDEELFQSGGNAYADYCEANGIVNYCALEADAGGFTPEGFSIDAPDSIFQILQSYHELLEPYNIRYIKKGGSGVDIYPLKKLGVPLMGYRTDSQRYMDVHHSAYDTFDKIHIRELQLGSGNMAALIYLIDEHGF